MYNKKILSLDDVKRVVAAAETEAARNQWNVVIAVVDDGGHLMYLQRERVQLGSVEDYQSPHRPHVSAADEILGRDSRRRPAGLPVDARDAAH